MLKSLSLSCSKCEATCFYHIIRAVSCVLENEMISSFTPEKVILIRYYKSNGVKALLDSPASFHNISVKKHVGNQGIF